MLLRYLGATFNVVASSVGLVVLVACVVTDAGWFTFPIVIVTYALSAFIAWFLLPSPPAEPRQVKPRRAA